MKVLHINASYKPARIYGGPTVSVSSLCEALAAAGINIDVFTTTANGNAELDVITNTPTVVDGVNVTYFKRLTKDHTHYSPALLKKLRQTANSYDVIHIHAWWNMVSVLSCLIALRQIVPVVLSPRGMLSNYSFTKQNSSKKSLIHGLLGKRLLKKVFIHVTAQSEKQDIEKIVQPKGFSVIPNIIQLPQTVHPTDHREQLFKMIFLSRIDHKKGLDVLFEALALIKLNWQLTIAGSGDEEYIQSLKAIAQNLNISDHIIWAGFAGDEKFELLAQHDLFILPSYNENFGNAVIESLSVGTAVLISENVGLANYVSKNDLGWICKVTPVELSETINTVALNGRDKLTQIRQNGPEIIHRDFDSTVLVKQYINLYTQLIAK